MAKLNVQVIERTKKGNPKVVAFEGAQYKRVKGEVKTGDIITSKTPGKIVDTTYGGYYEATGVDSDGDPIFVDDSGDERECCLTSVRVFRKIDAKPAVEPKTEKRRAKVGERILITNAYMTGGNYENGDKNTVRSVREDGAIYVKEHGVVIHSREYEVIVESDANPAQLKVGEYAKVIGNTSGHRFPDGEIVRVVSESGEAYRCEYIDGSDWWLAKRKDVIPATDDEVASAKADAAFTQFQPGDKVRLVSGGGVVPLLGYEDGGIYEVRKNDSQLSAGRKIKIGGGKRGVAYASPDQLEKVTAEELAEIERKQAVEAKWAAIGRKPLELKVGDIVRFTEATGASGYPKGSFAEVEGINGTACGFFFEKGYGARNHWSELITPVEARFDRG